MESLSRFPFVDTPSARVDVQRSLRSGIPEVIFGPGKSAAQICEIVRALREAEQDVLVTRLEPGGRPGGAGRASGRRVTTMLAGLLWFGRAEVPTTGKGIDRGGDSAGTSDLPVAAEAAGRGAPAREQGRAAGIDVGVAGIHRLLASATDRAFARRGY